MIEIQGHKIKKSFANKNILNNLSIKVFKGEFVTIIGKSGSGKSTLLDIINELTPIEEGEIIVCSSLATVFQSYEKSLYPHLNALQNVMLPFDFENIENKNKSIKYLNLVGLSNDIKKRPSQLSGGMNQRVALARALAQEPDVLLLDEPFGAIDFDTRNSLLVELQKIRMDLNLTVVMVTHNIDEAIYLSSRVLYLDKKLKNITKEFSIDIPFPRSIVNTMTSLKFNNYKKEILETYSFE
jgi:NitT/TauT family transport system ATP-binding protein